MGIVANLTHRRASPRPTGYTATTMIKKDYGHDVPLRILLARSLVALGACLMILAGLFLLFIWAQHNSSSILGQNISGGALAGIAVVYIIVGALSAALAYSLKQPTQTKLVYTIFFLFLFDLFNFTPGNYTAVIVDVILSVVVVVLLLGPREEAPQTDNSAGPSLATPVVTSSTPAATFEASPAPKMDVSAPETESHTKAHRSSRRTGKNPSGSASSSRPKDDDSAASDVATPSSDAGAAASEDGGTSADSSDPS